MNSSAAVNRWIRGYDKRQGTLRVEYPLPTSWTTEQLQHLFGVGDDDPMVDCYAIGELQAGIIGRSIGQDLSASDFEFFLEADAE